MIWNRSGEERARTHRSITTTGPPTRLETRPSEDFPASRPPSHATLCKDQPTVAAWSGAEEIASDSAAGWVGQTEDVSDEDRVEVYEQLRQVIAWEVRSQIGVQRAVQDMPPLIADTVLDYFDVALKPNADLSGLG